MPAVLYVFEPITAIMDTEQLADLVRFSVNEDSL